MKASVNGFDRAKVLLLVATMFLVLSVVLSVVSLFPMVTDNNQKNTIIDYSFRLSQNELYRQGLGAFRQGENISLTVDCQTVFLKNFSVVTSNHVIYSNQTNQNVTYAFTTGPNYYEVIFYSNDSNASWIHFQATVEKPQVLYPLTWLNTSAKTMFIISAASALVITLKLTYPKLKEKKEATSNLPSKDKSFRNRLLVILLISLVLWLVFLALNSNPLATFNNWYTDHVRDSYVSSLFLKDGFSVFNQPLGTLASQDHSYYMFVTWPEMPQLYPLGSILVFLPFGALLQSGFDPVLVYKLEIALFLVFAHVCLYFFLRNYLKKNSHLFWKIAGLYIIYVSLVLYAAGGMFDSIAFLFALIAVTMFLSERYDLFFLSMGVSAFFKYQGVIFLFPLIIFGVLKIHEKELLESFIRNKAVIIGIVLMGVSGFTAFLSAPFLIHTRQELVMNAINAFTPHAQITWNYQSAGVLLTLAVTLVYAAYMFNKNSLLSVSTIFLLLPSFMLPYFQYWYIPYFFVYALIPQRKKEFEITVLWLMFMIVMLCFSGNPLQIFSFFQNILKI
jgi:hypothetical protein